MALVQRGLEDFIGVDALGAVGGICADVIRAVLALTLHPPFTGRIGVINIIFKDPDTGPFDLAEGGENWARGWQTADEYLSGNVRVKLAQARASCCPGCSTGRVFS